MYKVVNSVYFAGSVLYMYVYASFGVPYLQLWTCLHCQSVVAVCMFFMALVFLPICLLHTMIVFIG